MAQKRMFDKKVVGSDRFIDLPNSSKALYFMAGMEADDKGFFQPRRLQKMCGFSDDDYKILIAKGFFITFESGVMVVTDWNKNNWLDSRRITETEYIDELNLLKLVNQKYEFRLENDDAKPLLSEYSIEENRIDKNRIDNKEQKKYFEDEKLNEIFNEFLQLRKKLKAVNSERAINSLLKTLEKYDDETKYKMIENSIRNSWKDVYEIRTNNNMQHKETRYERERRILEEMCKDE